MAKSELAKKAEKFAKQFAETQIVKTYLFHSVEHFEKTVDAAKSIGEDYLLNDEDLEDLVIAMWFHDLGFNKGWEGHEERSAQIAREFLISQNVSEDKIRRIAAYIRATRPEKNPEGLIEQIVKDADTSHIGDKDYFETLAKLRTEWETHGEKKFGEKEWKEINLKFLEDHQFYTSIAQNRFGERKRKNILKLQKQLSDIKDFEKMNPSGENQELSYIVRKSERGVETMFRVTLRNHNNLSRIADNKANIMLSINAIMLSIIISSLVPNLGANPSLLIPTIILILVCLASIILATLSTRPKITSAKYSDEKFLNKKFNILFFGNFYQIPIDKFEWGVKNLMHNEELLYSSLTKDLYYLGLVLANKYRYLNICYNVFMIGLLLAAASFIISIAF